MGRAKTAQQSIPGQSIVADRHRLIEGDWQVIAFIIRQLKRSLNLKRKKESCCNDLLR
jgi:hypothetical protein